MKKIENVKIYEKVVLPFYPFFVKNRENIEIEYKNEREALIRNDEGTEVPLYKPSLTTKLLATVGIPFLVLLTVWGLWHPTNEGLFLGGLAYIIVSLAFWLTPLEYQKTAVVVALSPFILLFSLGFFVDFESISKLEFGISSLSSFQFFSILILIEFMISILLYGRLEMIWLSSRKTNWVEVLGTKKPSFAKVGLAKLTVMLLLTSTVASQAEAYNGQYLPSYQIKKLKKMEEALSTKRAYDTQTEKFKEERREYLESRLDRFALEKKIPKKWIKHHQNKEIVGYQKIGINKNTKILNTANGTVTVYNKETPTTSWTWIIKREIDGEFRNWWSVPQSFDSDQPDLYILITDYEPNLRHASKK